MKLYQLFVLSHAFFHMFSCSSMNLIIDFGKEYHFDSKRILFPESERQRLIKFCNAQLYTKHRERFDTESCKLLHQIKDRQKTHLALKSEGVNILEEISILEKQVKTLKKELILVEEKESIITSIKSCSIKKQPLPDKKIIRRPAQSTDRKLTPREKLRAIDILKRQYSVKEKPQLLDALRDEADKSFHANRPGFDKKNHFLRQQINTQYRFVFCPCTRQLAIVDYSTEVPLPKDFACSDKCQFYRAKNASSSDSEINTSTESESDSDTKEEIPQVIPYTKQQIENLADYM